MKKTTKKTLEQRVKELEKKGYFVKVHGGLIIATGPGGRIEEKI